MSSGLWIFNIYRYIYSTHLLVFTLILTVGINVLSIRKSLSVSFQVFSVRLVMSGLPLIQLLMACPYIWIIILVISFSNIAIMTLNASDNGGAAVAEWLSSWLAEQEDRSSIPGLATWIFRDWLSPASKSRYGRKIAKSTLILKTTNNQSKW